MRGAPLRLRCEYLHDPIGLEVKRPRLSWWLNDDRPAEVQTAYQIQAASSARGLQSGAADLWDTGYLPSYQTLNVEYAGRPLCSGSRVWWRVRCYDSDGTPSPWSDIAHFELGLLESGDWQGVWIAAPLCGTPTTTVPVPMFWHDFEVSRPVLCARLHVAVLGRALVEINGHRPAEQEPFPAGSAGSAGGGPAPYRSFDVTALIRAGANRLGLLLGDGDHCGRLAGGRRQRSGQRPAVLAQLVLELDSGEQLQISTHQGWRWLPSWILRGDRDAGEEVDGRQWQPRWSLPGAGDEGMPVIVAAAVADQPRAECLPPVRVGDEPIVGILVRRERLGDGRFCSLYDFGRTLVGRVRIDLSAPRSSGLALRYGDLAPAGLPHAAADQGAQPPTAAPAIGWQSACDAYTARGGGTECFEPRFAVHAFRLVEAVTDSDPAALSVVALELEAGLEKTAEFHCDHRLLEQLFTVTARTCRMGLALGPVAGFLPEDRWAVSADLEPMLSGAAACLDVAPLWRDWLQALSHAQASGGSLPGRLPHTSPSFAPGSAAGLDAEPGFQAESLLPGLWYLYRCNGDRRLLEQSYPAVQRYLAAARERFAADPADAQGLGDQMLSMAWYCYGLVLATRMAGVLGRLPDLEAYDALASRCREVFRTRFVTPEGLLAEDHQLGYLLALELGLLEGKERRAAVVRLEAQLRGRGYRPSVDLRYAGLLLEVLTLEDRTDLAYQVLLQTSRSGWLHHLQAGATVLWDVAAGRPGQMAMATAARWLQQFLLGLELDRDLTPDLNAYRRMRIAPRPPLEVVPGADGPVRQAAGYLDTVHGRYECAWQLDANEFRMQIRVPGNCTARVVLPDGAESVVVAGEHAFCVPLAHASAGEHEPADEIPVLQRVSEAR